MHTVRFLVIALTTCTVTATVPALITLAPRAQPTFTPDPWQCLTENLTQYLDVPKPTGSLFTEIKSYAYKLYEPCIVASSDICPFPAQSDWCAFTTAAPADVLPAYSSYASQAYSWWAARSSVVVPLIEECPYVWQNGLLDHPGAEGWFNDTIELGAMPKRLLLQHQHRQD